MSGGDAVTTHGISERYGRETALDGVNLRVPEGAVYVLVGANGAGKSSTLKVLMNLERADAGTAEIHGLDTVRRGPEARAQVGYVPERPDHSYRWMTCRGLLKHVAAYYPTRDHPRTRAEVPLLRATDSFLTYRKGPFAMYALREYAGTEQINAALRRLLERHGSGTPPLPTSLDLYRELQAAIPQSLHYLLVDLFEANTFWELATQRVTAKQTETGTWQVTLDVKTRKVVVDTAGVETEVPMDDLIEVGVFTAAKAGGPGEPLYLQMHRVRSGEHRITVMVASKPARAGIDPRNLLIDVEGDDNLKEITRAEGQKR